MVQSESVSRVKVQRQTGAAAFTTQDLRLDFSITLRVAKGTAQGRYAVSVTRNLLTLEKTTSVQGSVTAADEAAAEVFAVAVLGAYAGTTKVRAHRSTAYEKEADDALTLVRLDFDEEWVETVSGSAGVLEMEVTEEVQYSGVRWVVQQVPFVAWDELTQSGTGGVSIVQPAGMQEGRRTVRGFVTSAVLVDAQDWALQHRAMLTGPYTQPESVETQFTFDPGVHGHPTDATGTPNVRLHRVNFTFVEILPSMTPLTPTPPDP